MVSSPSKQETMSNLNHSVKAVRRTVNTAMLSVHQNTHS